MGRARGRATGDRGFTLMEIILVMTIAGIVASLALPAMNQGVANFRMVTAGREMAGNIRYVQQMAVSGSGQAAHILFNTVDQSYQVREGMTVHKTVALPSGITMSVPFAGSKLAFSLDGAPTAAGQVQISDSFGRSIYVVVMPATGRVRVTSQP